MPYASRDRSFGSSSYGGIRNGVKWLLIVNFGLFVLNFLTAGHSIGAIFGPLGLVPGMVVNSFAFWQPFTYMFLHSTSDLWHVLFNMLTLWMFGVQLEARWGTREFLRYYFLCGIGAGICVILANYLYGTPDVRVIGASGAIYGLLLAYAVFYPDAPILFAFIFPMKAKYFVIILGAIAFLMSARGGGGTVSHVAHLGGMLVGWLYLRGNKTKSRLSLDPVGYAQRQYQDWKLKRAKRKFEVYLRKQSPNRPDDRIH